MKIHRRRKARNAWKGAKRGHRLAALKGWRKRKHTKRAKRRKSHARKHRWSKAKRALVSSKRRYSSFAKKAAASGDPLYGYNPRRRKHSKRRKHSNPGRSLMRSFNPSGIVKSATSAMHKDILKKGAVVVGGAILNEYSSTYLALGLNKILPSSVQIAENSPLLLVTGLASAGLTTIATSKFAPKYAASILLGGVVQVIKQAVQIYGAHYLPHAPSLSAPVAIAPLPPVTTKGYMGDYLTPMQVRDARQLNGMGDYLTPAQVKAARPLGDYLTPAQFAAARPLNNYTSDLDMSGLGYDEAFEGDEM